MATRIKASAMRRRVKRRGERASYKKKANATTLRSRKQRGRKTARKVMRGGKNILDKSVQLIYEPRPQHSNTFEFPKNFLRLQFSSNLFGKCYTLKLVFDLNSMLLYRHTFNKVEYYNKLRRTYEYYRKPDLYIWCSIPSIIDGLFHHMFDSDYTVRVPQLNKIKITETDTDPRFDFGNDESLEKYANIRTNLTNIAKDGMTFDVNCMSKGKFTEHCVVELEFCPSDENTTVQLKKYTNITEGEQGSWGWSTMSPKNKTITVNKRLDVTKLSTIEQFELFLPHLSLKNEPLSEDDITQRGYLNTQFYWFDTAKLSAHKQFIETENKKRKQEFDDENKRVKDEEEAEKLQKEQKEIERRAGLTPEQRAAEDQKRAGEAALAERLKAYDN